MLLLCFAFPLIALDLNDPNDPLYKDIEIWQEKGFLGQIPPLKPYGSVVILEILDQVIRSGYAIDRKRAYQYKKQIKKKLDLGMTEALSYESDFKGGRFDSMNFLAVRGLFLDAISIWSKIGFHAVVNEGEESIPMYERANRDVIRDNASFNLGKLAVALRYSMNGLMTIGKKHIFLKSGVVRHSFGPINNDGIVLSPRARQTGHLSTLFRVENFSITSAFLMLVGSNLDSDKRPRIPEKYLVLRSYNWMPFKWLDINFFETIIYGGRLEPMYFLPFSELFYNQGMVGFSDNSLMGLSARVPLPKGVEVNLVGYVDDIHFNDLIKLDFDTKYKLALQGALSWTPGWRALTRIALDYTLVTPYMYTHQADAQKTENDYWQPGEENEINSNGLANYQNYINWGENLGPGLLPNSDRIALSVLFRPWQFLDIEFKGKYIRHGNGSIDGSTNVVDTEGDGGGDGSYSDDGFDDTGEPTFQETTRFLTQDILEHVIQLGLDCAFSFPLKFGELSMEASYTFEHIINPEHERISDNVLQPKGYETNNYFSINLKYAF